MRIVFGHQYDYALVGRFHVAFQRQRLRHRDFLEDFAFPQADAPMPDDSCDIECRF